MTQAGIAVCGLIFRCVEDTGQLYSILDRLVDADNTVKVIENNLDVMTNAD